MNRDITTYLTELITTSSSVNKMNLIDAYFVVKVMTNLQYKIVKWKRKLPKNIISDATTELTGFYPRHLRPVYF
jgi:hypothetical protein